MFTLRAMSIHNTKKYTVLRDTSNKTAYFWQIQWFPA